MQAQKNTYLYAIVAANLFGLPDEVLWHVAWQPPAVIEDDGYFWTTEEMFLKVLKKKPENNEYPHKFAFQTEEEARAFAQRHRYLRNCQYSIKRIACK